MLQNKFNKQKIIEILSLFNNRANDEKITNLVSSEATIPTIFEYIIAVAWCYIDEFNVERILDAGLSLDSNMLPKSHAVGGSADFVFDYKSHFLMIEVTLTQSLNQRRAEMESVSRHLGNLLLNLDAQKRKRTYAIFIAPYLDKNVLNDFRSRIYCYFENEHSYIKGMNILPLSVNDLIVILNSNTSYKKLDLLFTPLFKSQNDFGSKWYKNEVKKVISNL